MSTLSIENLVVEVAGQEILHGVDLEVRSGEVHAVMGPNGAGKSTLSGALMGHPSYTVTSGSVSIDGVDLTALPTWRRAAAGLFLAPQDSTEVPGVQLADVLAASLAARGIEDASRDSVARRLAEEASAIGLSAGVAGRSLNAGASGGEKKRLETLQLAVLKPRFAILDELDSGLDVDALREVAKRVVRAVREEEQLGVVAITHYRRLLDVLEPDVVHVLVEGRIVASGGPDVADELERSGYAGYRAAG